MEKNKVVIIGSGIAGMTCAIYLKRGGLDPIIIENNAPGGTLNYIPNIENYPGYTSVAGPDLAMNIYNQVNNLNIKYLFKNIEKIDLEKKIIDDEITFDYLVIATGKRNRLLGIEGEEKLLGRGVSTCALCDGNFYKGKVVTVVGGGSSALTESLYLASICKKVNIIIRREDFTGEDHLIEKILNIKNIMVIRKSNVIKYNTKGEKLVSITLDSGKKVTTDGVFLAIGSTPNSDLFDVEKDHQYIVVDSNYETGTKDIYAIGDVIKKDYYQLTTATGDATVCAGSIIKKSNNK